MSRLQREVTCHSARIAAAKRIAGIILKERPLRPAALGGPRAARCECASVERVSRLRRLPRESRQSFQTRTRQARNAFQQRGGIGMTRMPE